MTDPTRTTAAHDVSPEGVRPFPPLGGGGIGPEARGTGLSSGEIFGSLVRDLMTRRVVTVEPADTLRFAATLLGQKDISGLPVVGKDGRVVGVLSEKDILRVLREKAGFPMPGGLFDIILETSEARQKDVLAQCRTVLHEVQVFQAMSSPALTVSPTTLTVEAARLMLSHHINRMPVVEHGKLVGIVSRANVLTLYHGPY
ncbi:MAG TPA: CBS domain-containing protein [Thermoplasmata archaeon]|nr:CBS domain-containing protein [Thermoplasmata archaeon]